MPAASYVSTPIERSLAFVKNSSGPNSLHGYSSNKFQNVDHTSQTILATRLDFIKFDKPSVKFDIKSKYHTLSSNDIHSNINSICSTYSKSKLSLNNVSSLPSNERKSLSSKDSSSNGNSKCLLPKPKEILYSPNKITLGWQGRVPAGAGLVNAINTCYLNSCLQALFHIPSFHNWLLNDTEHQTLCEKQSGYQFECLVCAMRKTLAHCQAKSGSAIRPELIIKKLKLIARHLEHHRQEDSHEFLTYLIEGIQKSYLKAIPNSNKLDSASKETTPIYQLFGTYLRTEVTCNSCSHISTSYTHSLELSLDIRQSSSLDEALGHFFAKEYLGGDNLYRCEKCGRKVEATKRFSVDKPPNVLRLQLKRFNYHGLKNSRSVQVPLHLEFGKFMHCRMSHSQLKYKLVSAVIHHGSSPDSGHYTCIGSTSSGSYHYFDDEMVRASNLQQLTNAYVVIYELLPISSHHLNSSLHSSSPGLASTSNNNNNNSNAGASPSPRKLIGPLLPHQVRPNSNVISSAVSTNIDVAKLTSSGKFGSNASTVSSGNAKFGNSSATSGNVSNGKFGSNGTASPGKLNGSTNAVNGSKLVNGSCSGGTPNGTPSSVLGTKLPLLNGAGKAPNTGSKLVHAASKGPISSPSKLPLPSFIKGSTTTSNGTASGNSANGSTPSKLVQNGNSAHKPSPSKEIDNNEDKSVSTGNLVLKKPSGGSCSSSPAKMNSAGRDTPSPSQRAGVKRTKLVDYESDDEAESEPDSQDNVSAPGQNSRHKKQKVHHSNSTSGSHKETSSSNSKPNSSSSSNSSRNGWRVLDTETNERETEEEEEEKGEIKVQTSGMQWHVVPVVTPPSNKSKSSSSGGGGASVSTSFDTIATSVSPACFPSTPSPSSTCSTGSSYFTSSLSSAGTGGSRLNAPGATPISGGSKVNGGGAGVSEYLNRRNMSGNNSYGSNSVTSWGDEPSTLVQQSSSQPQNNSKFPRYNAGGGGDREEEDEEMDRGRVKKVKSQHNGGGKFSNYYKPGGHNPFNYQQNNNNNRKSYNNNDKYHYYNKYNNNNNNHFNNKHRHQYRHRPYWGRH
ncbi:hypothetical protein M8J77_014180 [Diaphorina citri]|nr:hypothetical protein M8J77_014180 [Diaphorina citri]